LHRRSPTIGAILSRAKLEYTEIGAGFSPMPGLAAEQGFRFDQLGKKGPAAYTVS
jgi:hypothetical protein